MLNLSTQYNDNLVYLSADIDVDPFIREHESLLVEIIINGEIQTVLMRTYYGDIYVMAYPNTYVLKAGANEERIRSLIGVHLKKDRLIAYRLLQKYIIIRSELIEDIMRNVVQILLSQRT